MKMKYNVVFFFFLMVWFWKYWKFMLVLRIFYYDNGLIFILLCILIIFWVKNVWISVLNRLNYLLRLLWMNFELYEYVVLLCYKMGGLGER